MKRTTLRRILLVLVVALATSMVAAPTSSAAWISCDGVAPNSTVVCDPDRVGEQYVGWALLTRCWSNGACTRQVQGFGAWRWSGTAWQSTSLRGPQWVYVYPYSGRWQWVWTQQTGWLAIHDAELRRR